ncbi:hypothetical protein AQUCO_01600244v1 [Aquilegia coerulea]|uniref:F-box associated beta-propeller type 3 domain-containing protein n=1 Tax=Aquilegia coerulea TaxID=218851 RepID=A0A2G5DQR8_AQUCA|nr:hypothetical protein AQUCO_01600244v1 [Aquilegia coerulea]
MDYPFKSCLSRATILGSCNAIFLVGVYVRGVGPWYPCSLERTSAVFEVLGLWNPSTREFKELPDFLWKFIKHRPLCGNIAYGLGYDSLMDDYKVIRILYYYDSKVYESDVHVYSVRTNSYKRIRDVPYFIPRRHNHPAIVSGMFLNGAIHWLGISLARTSNLSLRIVFFNVENEEFGEIQLHDQFNSYMITQALELGVFEGCLCIYRFDNCIYRFDSADGYIMKQFGADDSWTNMLSLKQPAYANPGYTLAYLHTPWLRPCVDPTSKSEFDEWINYPIAYP